MDKEDLEILEGEYKAMLRPAFVAHARMLLDVLEAQKRLMGLPVDRSAMLDQMENEMPGMLSRYQPEDLSREGRTLQLELALEVITELRIPK